MRVFHQFAPNPNPNLERTPEGETTNQGKPVTFFAEDFFKIQVTPHTP